MVSDRLTQSNQQPGLDGLEAFRRKVVELHGKIDALTAELQDLDHPQRIDIIRRAEETGAALARLEWALDRADEYA